MREGKANQYGGPCRLCGGYVEPGAGVMERVASPDGEGYVWKVAHPESCPEPGQAPEREEPPRWAVPCRGLTPDGNEADGYTLVDGFTAHPGAVPINATAIGIRKREENERQHHGDRP